MELVEALKKGDKKAFQQLFDQYFLRLCSFGNGIIHDKEAVQDLVQDTFISLWDQLDRFDHLNAIKSFLYTTTRNKCLNLLKHKAVEQKNEPEILQKIEKIATTEQRIIEEEVFGQLYDEIENLPEASRKIMLLVLSGMKNREIADALSISENTVKTQKKIAYAKLKQQIKPRLYSFLVSLY